MSVAGASEHGLDLGFVAMGFAPDVGGIETHLAQLAQEFVARGHRVHVLCIEAPGERAPYTPRDELRQGVRVRRVAYAHHDHRALADLSERRAGNDAVMAWLAEEPCDVVHVHHASAFGAGLLRAIHEMARPLVSTLHDYWLLCPRGQMLHRDGTVCAEPQAEVCGACLAATWPHLMPSGGGERRDVAGRALETDAQAAEARTSHALAMLALPQRLFAPSAAVRAVFERAGVPAGRITVLANGVEASRLAREVAELRKPRAAGEPVRIGVLGAVQPSKGVLEFARAARAIPETDWTIEVHGALGDYHGDGGYVRALRELAREDPRIELHGEYAHADLARVLARLDLVAVPSRWEEAFGLSAREARAAGLTVLASDRGGLAELRGDPGVRLVPADDPAAWAEALARAVRAARSAGERRLVVPPQVLRSVHELALELERHYVDLVRAELGREPRLSFEPGSDQRTATGEAPAPVTGAWARWWRRLRS